MHTALVRDFSSFRSEGSVVAATHGLAVEHDAPTVSVAGHAQTLITHFARVATVSERAHTASIDAGGSVGALQRISALE